MNKNQSKEDYLKAVLFIRKDTGQCRSVDVAEHLNLSKASISRAVVRLSGEGLIQKNYDGQLFLTEEGEKYAEAVERKYALLEQVFLALGVSPETAKRDAGRIEHNLSEESYDKLLKWYQEKSGEG